jgi:hypothetical protein
VQERRRVPRGRTYLGGKIVFNDRYSSMDCLIRDMSPNGAKVIFTNTVGVPDEFDLEIKKTCETRRIRVVWRRADEAGVMFLDQQPKAELISLDLVRRLKACEAERDQLRSRVAELSAVD